MRYHMTEDQMKLVLDASRPVPYLVIGGVPPRSPQENANSAWRAVAAEHGCKWDTIKPAGTGDERDFDAEPA